MKVLFLNPIRHITYCSIDLLSTKHLFGVFWYNESRNRSPYLFVIGSLEFLFAKLQNDLAQENGKNNEIGSSRVWCIWQKKLWSFIYCFLLLLLLVFGLGLRCLFKVSQKESVEASSEVSEDEPEAVGGRFGLFLESFFFLFLLSDRFISGDRKTRPSSTNVFWPFSASTLFLEAVVVVVVGTASAEAVSFVNWHPGLLAVSRTGNQVTISGVRSCPGSSLRDFRFFISSWTAGL